MTDLPLLPRGSGVMLCGHGSRDARAVAEFTALAAHMKRRLPQYDVDFGFLEFATPIIRTGLDNLRAKGNSRILALPGMLMAAGHAKNDIPSVLNRYQAEHADVSISYGRDLGLDLKMLRAAGDRVQQALNSVGLERLRVVDVTQQAGVAVGLFYRYFPDLMIAIKEVSKELMTRFGRLTDADYSQGPDSLFERIRVYETVVVRNFIEAPGLMRVTRALGAIDKAHAARAVALFELHLEFIVTGVKRPKQPLSPARKSELLMRAEALAGMGAACLWARYVEKQRNLRHWNLTQEETAEWLSILFYRGLTGSQPKPQWLRHREKMAALLAWPFETDRRDA